MLELSSLYKIYKFLIIFAESIVNAILSTTHLVMIDAATFQTVMLDAGRTTIVIQELVILKNSSASSSWTPGYGFRVLLNIHIKSVLLVLLFQIPTDVAEYVGGLQRYPAAIHWALDLNLICLNESFDMAIDALFMKQMSTL